MFKSFVLGLGFVFVAGCPVAAAMGETELINRELVPIEAEGGVRGSGRLELDALLARAEPSFAPPRGNAPRETRGSSSRARRRDEAVQGEGLLE